MKTRVRFAPSPTGPLHMGGVRTALYNYLYAKQNGGDFIIRIEDTDSHRFVPGAEQYIIESLRWCGIIPDEGVDENGNVVSVPSEKHPHAPYRQSERRAIYRKYADQLVEAGWAYYAFDSAEALEKARAEAEAAGQTFIYNARSRGGLRNSLVLPEDEVKRLLEETTDWTVRFRMPEDTVVEMDDLIRGHIEVNTSTLDDKVLWKRADELPTYHLANIVDDHLMEITEVIRGEEWLPSLPLHYLLYQAFGWQRPRFAHLPLLLKPVGNGKLSKRDGDKMGFPVFPLNWLNSEGETYHGYREDGYFADAFVNLLAMLGWNPGTEQEIFSMEELAAAFSLDKVSKSGAKFNPDKAKWYNKEYLRMKSDEELAALFAPILAANGVAVAGAGGFAPADADGRLCNIGDAALPASAPAISMSKLVEVVSLIKERATFVKDFWTIASYLFIAPSEFEAHGVKAGAASEKPADPNRPVDPRAKVYDDSLTAPFLAKDVDKFWKPEARDAALAACKHVCGTVKDWTKENIEAELENYIKGNELPMGKVMNCTRMVLSGAASGLGIADIMYFIGPDEVMKRWEFALARLA